MLAGMRNRLTYANVMATIAVFIALGAGAYAAVTINSKDVVNNSLRSADLKDGKGVKGADVAPDSLGGADVDESTLGQVPSASGADSATDAGTVGGLHVRKINFQVPHGTGPTTVLDLAGLQITAECQDFGDILDVKAFTSKNDAGVYYFGGYAFGADDTDVLQEIDSDSELAGSFDIGDQLQIDNNTPLGGSIGIGTLNYSAPDGSMVVAHLALEEVTAGCLLSGMAIGG